MYKKIRLLTKSTDPGKKLSQEEKFLRNFKYINTVLTKAPWSVKIIKLEDRLNNMICTENNKTPKYKRYIMETEKLYVPFALCVDKRYAELLKKEIFRLKNS